MIDLHAHLLPQIDDGPEDWEESVALLKQGIDEGITAVVCTSHVLSDLNTDLEGRLLYRFEQLQKIVHREGLPITLYLASEIHCLARFDAHSPVATINGNRKYLLIEFPMNDIPENVGHILFQLVLDGVTPILAHPERNLTLLRDPDRIYSLIQRGVLMQINAGSLTGRFGEDVRLLALDMIAHHQAHVVASDCHDARTRPMRLKEAYRVVQKGFGQGTAEALFQTYPDRIVRGDPLEVPEPEPIRKRRKPERFFPWRRR